MPEQRCREFTTPLVAVPPEVGEPPVPLGSFSSVAARNDYERYLEEKWAGIAVDPLMLAEAVEEAHGCGISSCERWVRSYNNEVYAVNATDGSELVVRIARRPEGHFDPERWSRQRCAEVGVPVPEMFGVATRQVGDEVLNFSVEQRLRGETLELLTQSGAVDEDAAAVLKERAGHLLAQIHRVTPEGWGAIDGRGRGSAPDPSWQVAHLSRRLPRLRDIARLHRLAFKHVERAVELLAEANDPLASPSLTHGDFAPKHVLVDGSEIVAILDFEDAHSGTPFDDLGFWLYDQPGDRHALQSGYEQVARLDNFDRRLALSAITIGLLYLNIYGSMPAGASPPGFLASVARRLRADIEIATG